MVSSDGWCWAHGCESSDVIILLLTQGAHNITIDGVFHSMSRVGTYDTPGEHVWYGSREVVDTWAHRLV
jgi:hypothetical protein